MSYLTISFFPAYLIILAIYGVFIFLISFLVFLTGKILYKHSINNNLKLLFYFIPVLLIMHFIFANFWDLFIEGKGRDKLLYYWDQIPLTGFGFWHHERPATRTIEIDLAPGVTLWTLDLIWMGMLISAYVISLFICWILFWRKKRNNLVYATVICAVLFIIGLVLGFNKRGLVI